MKLDNISSKNGVAHYRTTVTIGGKTLKLDPYRIAKIYDMKGGAREQIMKKALRWTDKGHSEVQVLKEIISAAKRGLEMLKEDNEGCE